MDARVEKPTEGGVAPTFYKKYAHIFEFVVYVYMCDFPHFKSICIYLNICNIYVCNPPHFTRMFLIYEFILICGIFGNRTFKHGNDFGRWCSSKLFVQIKTIYF